MPSYRAETRPYSMEENKEKKEGAAQLYDLNAKWDTCFDLTIRRFVYSSLSGAFGGLLLFRSPVTRWASVAFGAGVGIGTSYTECSYKFDAYPSMWTSPKTSIPQAASQEKRDK
ncbi:MICOS complex subunit MIC10-like isoform X2 [Magnolia sinica]|uniref:MICOS complex subunit MIC10-like isoform X2 n=1 Tax=Magnolia sinica TaxID=86752 RepID=UPI0026581D77|nr:MICOS complex subunit MIC10-like isoform X2 [Magnolia sinica]